MASFEAKTFFNQGHPCFIATQENPLGPTGTAIRGPLVVLPGAPDSITDSVTQLLTDVSGNTQLANTNIATGVSQTTFNILADGTVNIDNLARPNPIQQWSATETTITAPILLSTISVGGDPFQISQSLDTVSGLKVTRMEVLDSANATIQWDDSGVLTLNSTVTVSNNDYGASISLRDGTIRRSIFATNGLGGATDTMVQWGIQSADAIGLYPGGIRINANANNGLPPAFQAYQDGNLSLISSFAFTNDPIPKMRVTSLTSPTYLETYSAGLVGETADGTDWTVRSLNTTGIEINASRFNGQAPAIQANPDGTTKINTGFTFGNSATNRLTVADSLGNKTTVDPVTLSLGSDPALDGFVLDPTGFTLNSSPLSLRLIQSPNNNAFTFITNTTNLSTMNIFDNRVQVANLQTFPGSLIVSNQTAYETGSSAYGGTQLTWNAVNPGAGNTEIINSYGSSPLGGFNVYSGADGCPKENLSTIMSLNLNYLTTPATISTPAIQVSSINVTGSFTGIGGLLPVGSVIPWAGGSYANPNAPVGFLICNGRGFATTALPDLFAVIGYTYGGSGATFYVPNLVRRGIMGAATTATPLINVTTESVQGTPVYSSDFVGTPIYISAYPIDGIPIRIGDSWQDVLGGQHTILSFYDFVSYGAGIMFVGGGPVAPFYATNTYVYPQAFPPGASFGQNRTQLRDYHVAAHTHTGTPNRATTALWGSNSAAENGGTTSVNNDLATYQTISGNTYSNINAAFTNITPTISMNYIIKT